MNPEHRDDLDRATHQQRREFDGFMRGLLCVALPASIVLWSLIALAVYLVAHK